MKFRNRDGTPPNFDLLRHQMVVGQLKRGGIRNETVLAAFEQVPREAFVPEAYRGLAYDDGPLPIGHGQTISQPFTVAFMIEALDLRSTDRVLEVGTGSGYAAALMSRIVREVVSLERIPELAESARNRIRELGYTNLEIQVADGTLGWPAKAPYDAILVSAGARSLPQPYAEQIADGGRIVIPIGPTPHSQSMWRYTRDGNRLDGEDLGLFAFVPLVGEYGWPAGASFDSGRDLDHA